MVAAPLPIKTTEMAFAPAPTAFSADGKILAATGSDGTVRLWDVIARQPIGLPIKPDEVQAVALSPDGKTLAAGLAIRLWVSATGQPIGGTIPKSDANAVAFSPNGKILAYGGKDGGIQLWDVAAQRQIGLTMSAANTETAVAFSPNGKILAYGGDDGTTRLWDVATQQEVGAPMTADAEPVSAVAFSPDSALLETASTDGTARLWDVALPDNLLSAVCAITGKSLTHQQWADYVGTQPFQQVCPAD
jgi:WD40 repeat protein